MIVRTAVAADAVQMAEILNPLIEDGTTTALETSVTAEDLRAWMTSDPARSSWHVAEDGGRIAGFQWAEPHDGLPPEAASIATFARIDGAGRGVGTALFAATAQTCRGLGYTWICAAIRSDNDSGLRYYSKMGFVTYHTDPNATLANGKVTGKTYKRFDL